MIPQDERAWWLSSGKGGAYPAFRVSAPLSIIKVFSGNGWVLAVEAFPGGRGFVVPML